MAGHRKARSGWMTDTKKPANCQASYLLRLRTMQESFVATEVKNMRNTVERYSSNSMNYSLNPLLAPREKPKPAEKGDPILRGTQRQLSAIDQRRPTQYALTDWYHSNSNSEFSFQKGGEKNCLSFPVLSEKEMARIISSMQSVRHCQAPWHGVIPNRLPTIPNIGHKSVLVNENRMRALLTEDNVSESPNIRKTRQVKKTTKIQRLRSPSKQTRNRTSGVVRVPTLRGPFQLQFNVDPKDRDVFRQADSSPINLALKSSAETAGNKFSSTEDLKVDSHTSNTLSLSDMLDVPPNSRPESPSKQAAETSVRIPEVVIEPQAAIDDQQHDNCGELSLAMKKLNVAKEELTALTAEVTEIVKETETLKDT